MKSEKATKGKNVRDRARARLCEKQREREGRWGGGVAREGGAWHGGKERETEEQHVTPPYPRPCHESSDSPWREGAGAGGRGAGRVQAAVQEHRHLPRVRRARAHGAVRSVECIQGSVRIPINNTIERKRERERERESEREREREMDRWMVRDIYRYNMYIPGIDDRDRDGKGWRGRGRHSTRYATVRRVVSYRDRYVSNDTPLYENATLTVLTVA